MENTFFRLSIRHAKIRVLHSGAGLLPTYTIAEFSKVWYIILFAISLSFGSLVTNFMIVGMLNSNVLCIRCWRLWHIYPAGSVMRSTTVAVALLFLNLHGYSWHISSLGNLSLWFIHLFPIHLGSFIKLKGKKHQYHLTGQPAPEIDVLFKGILM